MNQLYEYDEPVRADAEANRGGPQPKLDTLTRSFAAVQLTQHLLDRLHRSLSVTRTAVDRSRGELRSSAELLDTVRRGESPAGPRIR